jgi:hypothetical protein
LISSPGEAVSGLHSGIAITSLSFWNSAPPLEGPLGHFTIASAPVECPQRQADPPSSGSVAASPAGLRFFFPPGMCAVLACFGFAFSSLVIVIVFYGLLNLGWGFPNDLKLSYELGLSGQLSALHQNHERMRIPSHASWESTGPNMMMAEPSLRSILRYPQPGWRRPHGYTSCAQRNCI